MAKMDRMITVRMDAELHDKIMAKAATKPRGFSVAAHIRKALIGWVDK